MVEIYRHAFRYYWSVLPFLLGTMALLEGLLWYLEPKNVTTISLVPTLIIVYMFHRHFLFGETLSMKQRSSDPPPFKFGWFILISLALLLIPVVPSVIFAFSVAPSGSPITTKYVLMGLALVPLYLLGFSLFGTALPASVARDGHFSIRAGIRVGLGTMWRLLLGPGIAYVLTFGLTIGLSHLFLSIPAIQNASGEIVFGVIISTLSFLPSLLGVAVLCHMYQKIIAAEAARQTETASLS